MPKKPSDKIKRSGDLAALKAALGLHPYGKRKMNEAQSAAVQQQVIAHPAFPQLVKGFWPRAGVVEFAANYMELVKKGGKAREFGIIEKSEAGSRKPEVEMPEQPEPAGEGDLFLKLSPEEITKQQLRRLDYFEDIHLHPGQRLAPSGQSFLKLNPREEKELKSARPWLFNLSPSSGGGVDEGDEFTGGVEAVAAYIQLKFPGVVCNKMDISNWQRMKFLPESAKPSPRHPKGDQFPTSFNSGRNSKKKIDRWVKEHLVPMATEQALPGVDNFDYERGQKKINFERSQAEFKIWQQGTSNKFMETVTVLGGVEATFTHVGRLQDDAFEGEHGVLARALSVAQKVFNVTPEQLAVFAAQLRPELAALNGGMKNDGAEHWRDLWSQLFKDRKEQVQRTAKEV